MRAKNNCPRDLVDGIARGVHDGCYNVSSVVLENVLAKAVENNLLEKDQANMLAEQARIYASKLLKAIQPLATDYGRRKYLEVKISFYRKYYRIRNTTHP